MNHTLFPITYECNLSCPECCARDYKMFVDVKKNLDALLKRDDKSEWVFITGGEPFIVEDLPEICDVLRNNGYKVGVTTNGTFYRPDIAEHVDRIGISLDGPKEYHDSYRGQGVYDSALKLFNAIKGKCETVIMSVAFKENLEELKKLSIIVEELDPTYWQIQRDVFNPDLIIPDELKC